MRLLLNLNILGKSGLALKIDLKGYSIRITGNNTKKNKKTIDSMTF
jgi:hypothetical protein